MKVIVCFKLTPDSEDIEVKPDGSISLEKAEWTIGDYDLQAIEAGVRLAAATTGKVIGLTAGPHQINNSKLKKDVLSRGPDELVLVNDDALAQADTATASAVLAAAVAKLGGADLILCGEGSADLYFQQVGLQLGERLNLPTLNAVSKIDVEAGQLVVERSLEDEVEVLGVPLPAVLSVTTDINQPRLPTMKEILKASKKPVTEWSLADLGLAGSHLAQVEVLSTKAPRQVERKRVLIPGNADEAAQALVGYLSKEGVL
jgi:electron transfer flavoprotein beta subunit